MRPNLLDDRVIDVKVAEVVDGNKISNSQTECRSLCGVAENLKAIQLPHVNKMPLEYDWVLLTICHSFFERVYLEEDQDYGWEFVKINHIP